MWKVDSILRSILSGMEFLCKTFLEEKEIISFFLLLFFVKKKSFCYLRIQIVVCFEIIDGVVCFPSDET